MQTSQTLHVFTVALQAERLALTVAGGILVMTTMLPLLVLAGEVARNPAALAVLSSPRAWSLMFRSLTLAAATTTLAVLAGVPLALLFSRTDVPGRRLGLLLHAFPMFLPPFLLALGWFHLFGSTGLVGNEATARLLFSEVGVVLVLAGTFTPVVTMLVGLALDGIDRSLEEAALVVAPPLRATTGILIPLARPGLTLAGLVVFALALTELAVPMFLRVDVYPAAVFSRLGGIEYGPGEAFALALPMLAVSLALVALERRLVFRRSLAGLSLVRRDGSPMSLGTWRAAAVAATCLAALGGGLPVLALLVRAGPAGLLGMADWVGNSVMNSLLSAAAGATVIVGVGVVLGHGVARLDRWAVPFDWLAVLGFVVPAAVLGVGMIALWNRPATRTVYGTIAIVVVGYVARYAVIGVRTIASAVRQTPPHLEEAAAVFGGSYWHRLARIVIPVHARAAIGAWLMAAVFCLRDLETTILFYPPGSETLPVRIFTLEANGPPDAVAALAVLHVAVTAAVVFAALVVVGREKRW